MCKYATYSELKNFMRKDVSGFEPVLKQKDIFSVYYDHGFHTFWYVEEGASDTGSFCELELIASLAPSNEIRAEETELRRLFDSDVSGKRVFDDGTSQYMWFRKLKGGRA